jgi:hypothetical protein
MHLWVYDTLHTEIQKACAAKSSMALNNSGFAGKLMNHISELLIALIILAGRAGAAPAQSPPALTQRPIA